MPGLISKRSLIRANLWWIWRGAVKTVRDYHAYHRRTEGPCVGCTRAWPDVCRAQWQRRRLRSLCLGWISARCYMVLMESWCQAEWGQKVGWHMMTQSFGVCARSLSHFFCMLTLVILTQMITKGRQLWLQNLFISCLGLCNFLSCFMSYSCTYFCTACSDRQINVFIRGTQDRINQFKCDSSATLYFVEKYI